VDVRLLKIPTTLKFNFFNKQLIYLKGLRPNFIKKAKRGYKVLDMKPAKVAKKGENK
jgi:inorganic triphosphatase YgiF